MANRYSQIYNAPYVPQYAPPNLGAYQQAGNTLYQRQQQGMEQYDALRESMRNIDVLESAKPVLNEEVEKINKSLSQFEDTGDFIDAQPAIRRQARNLQQSLQEGKLADAVASKQAALETFEKIEESDWSPGQKELFKQQYLEGYNPKEGDRLNTWSPPEYVNIEEEAAKAAKDVEETTWEELGLVQDPKTGKAIKAKIQQKGREKDRIIQSVSDMFRNNDKVRNAILTEARLNGAESDQEIMEYANKKIESIALDMATRYGPQSKTFSNIQWEDMEDISASSKTRQTVQPGIQQDLNLVSDLGDHVIEMRQAKITGNENKRKVLQNGLEATMVTAIERGIIDKDEYSYFVNNMDKKTGEDITSYTPRLIGRSQNEFPDTTDITFRSDDEKFNEIYDKVSNFVEESGGIVASDFTFDKPELQNDIEEVFANQNPNSFSLVSDERRKSMSEKEQQKFIHNVLRNGRPQGIMHVDDDTSPFYRFSLNRGTSSEPDYETIFLREKSTPNIKEAGYKTPFETIVNRYLSDDDVANQLLGTYMLNKVPTVGKNVYNELPPVYKANMQQKGSNYISLQSVGPQEGQTSSEAVTIEYGSEDNHKPVKQWDWLLTNEKMFNRQYRNNPKQAMDNYSAMQRLIENTDSLHETEKRTILEALGSEQKIPKDLENKLKDALDKKHVFSNKIEAINFVTGNQRYTQ